MSPETVPAALLRCTIQNAARIKPGPESTTGAFSAPVNALSEGVLKAMFWTRIRTAIVMTLLAGITATSLGLVVSGGASEAGNQVSQEAQSSKGSAPGPAPEAKQASTTVTKTEPAHEPDEESYEAPRRVIALGDQTKIWAYDPRTKTWHTYKAPLGVRVDPEITRSGSLVAPRFSGESITEVAAFSAKAGKWSRQALVELPTVKDISPFMGNNYAVYAIGNHLYAYSSVTGKWNHQALTEPAQVYVQNNGANGIMYWSSRSIHAFSSLTGTWATMDLEKGKIAERPMQMGPSGTTLVVNGSRLYSYDPAKGQFEGVKADED
jgi:hypothetical protein